VDQTVALAVITELMTATGAVLLVALIARIEMRAAARDEEIRAQLGPVGSVAPMSTQPSTDAPPPAPGAPVIAGAIAPMDTSSRGVPGVAAAALGVDAMPAPAPTNPQPLRTADAVPSPEAGTRTPGSRPLTIPRPDLGGSPPTHADTGPVAPPPPPPPAR
jgi:Wiskott-Aldrich syndrome protein